MANRFFTNLIDILPFTRARSVDLEAHFSAIGAGFDQVQAELDANKARAVSVPDGEPGIGKLPTKAVRASKAAGYDANGDPVAIEIATTAEMSAAVAAAVVAVAAKDEAVLAASTLTSSVNELHRQMTQRGVT
jgi:hypothetical protein